MASPSLLADPLLSHTLDPPSAAAHRPDAQCSLYFCTLSTEFPLPRMPFPLCCLTLQELLWEAFPDALFPADPSRPVLHASVMPPNSLSRLVMLPCDCFWVCLLVHAGAPGQGQHVGGLVTAY